MKANAPEKIYRTTTYLDNDKGKTLWKIKPVMGAENIEYVRKDAFIEKAQDFFRQSHHLFGLDGNELYHFIEDFRRYIKEE